MKSIALNKLYGVLTNGDNTERKTTIDRAQINSDAKKIVTALISDDLSGPGKRAMAELYIRLIETHKNLWQKLLKYDSINSYRLHSFAPEFSDADVLDKVIAGIKLLGLSGVEQSFLPLDYIMNALDKLLDELNG